MNAVRRIAAIALTALMFGPALGWGQEAGRPENEVAPKAPPEVPPVVTQHQIRAGGSTIRYTATAGYMPMKDEDGELKANIFFVAYTRDDVGDVADRPLTFSFNGGPGSSSVWLHLGAIGPRRALMTDNGDPLPPPYELVDNQQTWLAFSDLVFIDPVLTGYSRPAPGEDKEQFHGVEEDVESVADFIRLYTTKYERWSSPKFLAGESYGTTRAAGLSGHLQERHGMYLNGIVLVSSVLNFQTLRFAVGNDLPYVLFVPTYTATAWYHGQLADDLQVDLERTLAEAREFALGDYSLALMKGADLSGAERHDIARRLARYTGLTPEYVERSDLRINIRRFVKELLRDEGRTVGRLDSRFKGMDRDDVGENYEFDPSYAAIRGTYTATLNAYVREELEYESDLPYEILSGRVRPWNWGSAGRGYVNVAETLREAMSQNENLHVLVASGYYDLATPFFATEYTFSHLGGDPSLLTRVTQTYYESGHMMYIHRPSLEKLTAAVREFMHRALERTPGEMAADNGV
ncbi:MAG: peptidase S10 [Gemmatimonadota bacterium]